jgi:hypothetical protein
MWGNDNTRKARDEMRRAEKQHQKDEQRRAETFRRRDEQAKKNKSGKKR